MWGLGSAFEVWMAYTIIPTLGWRYLVVFSSLPMIITALCIWVTTLNPKLQEFRILSHFLLMLPLLDFAGVSQIFGGGWSQRWSFKNFNWWCQTQQTVVAKRRACQINSGQSLSFKSSTKIKIDTSFMSCKCRLPLEVVLSTCFVRNIGAQPSACLLYGSELHFSTMASFLLSRKF